MSRDQLRISSLVDTDDGHGPDLIRPRPHLRILPGKVSGEPHLHHSRTTTLTVMSLVDRCGDVDKVAALYPELESAVVKVAERHGLSSKWLNDSATASRPPHASYEACEVAHQRPNLEVRTSGPRGHIAMKLYRADPQDREDLVSLWPLCEFSDPEAAVAAFRNGYPHAPEDEYLGDYIADVAGDAAV